MIDGRVCPPGEAHISVYDRGFLYGDSVFETLRTYGGEVFALGEHLERLARSAARVFIPMPVVREELGREVATAVARAGNAESYVRVMVTRGQGELGLDPSLAAQPRRVILVQKLVPLPEQHYTEGVKAITYRTARLLDDTGAAGAKIGNYLVNVLATREARLRGGAEALIVDREGRLLEGASSNIFLVCAGRLITPPVEAGILEGITRRHVLRAANACGVDVELSVPQVEQAYAADELFITSSIRELVPVVQLDETSIGTGQPGPLFARLRAQFSARVRGGVSSAPPRS